MRKRAKNKYEKEEKDKSTTGHYVPMCTNGNSCVKMAKDCSALIGIKNNKHQA